MSSSTKLLTDNQLHDAMMFVFDCFDRAVISYFVLGDIAKQVRESYQPMLSSDKVEVGVMRNSIVSPMFSLFLDMLGTHTQINNRRGELKRIEFMYNDVPVVIKIFDKDHGVFGNPDLRFFGLEQVWIPNPFEVYWQKRGLL